MKCLFVGDEVWLYDYERDYVYRYKGKFLGGLELEGTINRLTGASLVLIDLALTSNGSLLYCGMLVDYDQLWVCLQWDGEQLHVLWYARSSICEHSPYEYYQGVILSTSSENWIRLYDLDKLQEQGLRVMNN